MLTTTKIAEARGITPQRVRQVLVGVDPIDSIGGAAIYAKRDVDRAFARVRPGGKGWRRGKSASGKSR